MHPRAGTSPCHHSATSPLRPDGAADFPLDAVNDRVGAWGTCASPFSLAIPPRVLDERSGRCSCRGSGWDCQLAAGSLSSAMEIPGSPITRTSSQLISGSGRRHEQGGAPHPAECFALAALTSPRSEWSSHLLAMIPEGEPECRPRSGFAAPPEKRQSVYILVTIALQGQSTVLFN